MSTIPPSLASEADYVWEVATLFPEQGRWSEEAYLELTDGTNRRIELVKGRLEFLPMPTELHQALVGFLYHALLSFVAKGSLGIVPFPPLRVRIRALSRAGCAVPPQGELSSTLKSHLEGR